MVRAALVAAALALGATVAALPQSPRFVAHVDTVVVYATARGPNGALVPLLTRDDFRITEDGAPREIVAFSNEPQPITLAIVLDRSGSTSDAKSDVTKAAEAFIARLIDGDRASVMTLSWDCLAPTGDRRVLVRMVQATARIYDMGSPIWSAVQRGLGALAPEPGRRALLLFSDGDDNGSSMNHIADFQMRLPPGPCQPVTAWSRATAEDVGTDAAREGILVYAVGVDGRTQAGVDMRGHLVRVTQDSGGEYLQLTRASRLQEAFTRIADELHQQYTLGFRPAVFDGKEHRIEVKSTRPGITVRARRRFVAAVEGTPEGRVPPRTPPLALPSLTDDEVREAIEAGTSGRATVTTCQASSVMPNAGREDAVARVRLEGPFDRIARLAAEAAARGERLAESQITEEMRAPILHVAAELVGRRDATGGADPSSPSAIQRLLTVVRIFSDDRRMPALNPLTSIAATSASLTPRGFIGGDRISATYDLAAFRWLTGEGVEVAVYSLTAERTCRLSARERARVR